MKDKEKLDEIRAARDKIEKAKKVKCSCTGFMIQYEGRCRCEKGIGVAKAQAELANLIYNLK